MTEYTTSAGQTHDGTRADGERWRLQSDTSPFDRAWKLWVLDHAALPKSVAIAKTPHGTVRDTAMAAVLRSIDSHARGHQTAFPSLETIAAESRISVKHARRAIIALESLRLLEVAPRRRGRRRQTNEYRIAWLNLDALIPEYATCRETEPPRRKVVERERTHSTGREDILSGTRGHTVPDERTYCPPTRPKKRPKETPPPPSPSFGKDDDWTGMEEEIRSRIRCADEVLTRIRTVEYTAAEIIALCRIGDLLREAGAIESVGGALHWRLLKSKPGSPVTDGWPLPPADVRRAIDRQYAARVRAMTPADCQRVLARCVVMRAEAKPLYDYAESVGWDAARPELRPHLIDALRYLDAQEAAR